ncbi:hypothetical protein [Phyllobacterium sp. YR620]|uniref:hypothetical protein n=1 Tax=Phyllobacterium sp. YR620 TaxID=1881066 RepID=UPI0011137D47|nr:hypothetical protein [Phyllobacterium sp. YR620]
MLKRFLHLGADYRWLSAPLNGGQDATVKRYKNDMRRAAGVSVAEFEDAWAGRLKTASPRKKLWAALNVRPNDLGVLLLDDGSQEVIE